MKNVFLLVLLLVIAGCSNRAVYENLQINQRNKCQQGPQAAYEECMRGVDKSYEEYERERQEHLKASRQGQ